MKSATPVGTRIFRRMLRVLLAFHGGSQGSCSRITVVRVLLFCVAGHGYGGVLVFTCKVIFGFYMQ